MDLFEGIEFNTMMFIGPIIVLFVTISGLSLLYFWLFSWLPRRVFNSLFGLVGLAGLYIWAIPLKVGFYSYFKQWGI